MQLKQERMTREQAIILFGGKAEVARALGISRQAVHQWPDLLSRRMTDQVRGALVRLQTKK